MLLYGLGIAFFCFFYTAVQFNSEETAENLKRHGGFIPGIRPGKATEEYFDYLLNRITVVGAAYLVLICLIPEMLVPGRPHIHARRNQPADRGQRDHGHGQPDPEPFDRAPIWRPDQEGQAQDDTAQALAVANEGGSPRMMNIIGARRSRARLSARTFTRGSPNRPNVRSSMLSHDLPNTIFGQIAFLRNTRNLEHCALPARVWVETAARRRDEIDGNRRIGFSAFSFSTSSFTRSISAWLVGPRFEPAELAAL